MTETRDQTPNEDQTPVPPVGDSAAGTDASPAEGQPVAADERDTTVGTGTSIALGCVAGTLVLVVIGLLFLFVVMIIS